ncbi:MAG: type I restriction enzyme HsdR N-terminal domain-containing protein [Nitrospirae bacterium]|nr:type I restriction enzyme HsdR N-terminal domain-containing protein [Nitrospirota bacterium]
MFGDFDFSALDEPAFKEDAVREELVAPLLKRLGYSPTGRFKVVRSKALVHPFVMIGSKRYPVNIVPDYTLLVDDEPLLVLDAKRPGESIVKSHHVEQAFSYAIHPEVRCNTYGLCNGQDLVLYDVRRTGPIFKIALADTDKRWGEVVRAFDPRALRIPEIRHFKFDFGLYVLKLVQLGSTLDSVHKVLLFRRTIPAVGSVTCIELTRAPSRPCALSTAPAKPSATSPAGKPTARSF